MYGIEEISSHLQPLDLTNVTQLFTNLAESEVCRPIGEIDVLIGLDYAAFQPQIKDAVDHLVVVENDFGKCLSGKHPLLRETTKTVVSYAQVNHFVSQPTLANFFEYESLGVDSKPKCGACKCGRCPIGGKDYNLKEEKKVALIEKGLEHKDGCWTATYPWIRSPSDLPDNRSVAVAILKSTEIRLLKDSSIAKQYQEQMEEMVMNGVARKMQANDLGLYDGPEYYISLHQRHAELFSIHLPTIMDMC